MNKNPVERVTDHIVAAVETAPQSEDPFLHLTLSNVFPDDVYTAMLERMPSARSYRDLPGRGGGNIRADGVSTRVKVDLFPEFIRRFAPESRPLWETVGKALRSDAVRDAFLRKLAPEIERRFSRPHRNVGMYPIPVLTRDIPGYRISPHTDTHWKGITVQLYLPRHSEWSDIGTVFYAGTEGALARVKQIPFVPNSGYAFAVTDKSWHSADPVHERVTTRDSILLTYFVDQGLPRALRNRAKRAGNFVLNEIRQLAAR